MKNEILIHDVEYYDETADFVLWCGDADYCIVAHDDDYDVDDDATKLYVDDVVQFCIDDVHFHNEKIKLNYAKNTILKAVVTNDLHDIGDDNYILKIVE